MSSMAMAPIEEGSEKDLETGPDQKPLPPIRVTYAPVSSSLTPRKIMMNSGRTLAISNSSKMSSTPTHASRVAFGSVTELDEFAAEAETPSPSGSPSLIGFNTAKTLAIANPNSAKRLAPSCSPIFTESVSSKSLFSLSGRRMDQRKMYVKQVTGRHKDTELHLMAKRGDEGAVRQILAEIDGQMTGTPSEANFDNDLAEMRIAIVNEVNELGETALFTAAEKGYLGVVTALLPYMTQEGISAKNRCGLDALHVAATQGHEAIVKVLLNHNPGLCTTLGPSNVTPLVSAAVRGHLGVVNELLTRCLSLLEIPKTNGKNALHMTARQGHTEVVQALLDRDPQLARRTDKKGQTALHMAVKGQSSEVVRLILQVDPAIASLTEKYGNTALHVATRKKRVAIVNELLLIPETNVNALTRDSKTPLDIAESLPLCTEISEIKVNLMQHGGVKARDLDQPRDELRWCVTEIQKDVHNQLLWARRTNQNVDGIAKELKKLHREGINNATNSVTVVAVLFATVAFAAIFTVPGGDTVDGTAVMVRYASFKIFFIFNAISLFTSLAVVVVQMTLVRGETKAERKVVKVINKLMWLASVCTTVSFISSAYIVIGRHHKWAAIFVTVLGTTVMAGVLGTMTFFVVKYRKIRKKGRKGRSPTSIIPSHMPHDADLSDLENSIYAI